MRWTESVLLSPSVMFSRQMNSQLLSSSISPTVTRRFCPPLIPAIGPSESKLLSVGTNGWTLVLYEARAEPSTHLTPRRFSSPTTVPATWSSPRLTMRSRTSFAMASAGVASGAVHRRANSRVSRTVSSGAWSVSSFARPAHGRRHERETFRNTDHTRARSGRHASAATARGLSALTARPDVRAQPPPPPLTAPCRQRRPVQRERPAPLVLRAQPSCQGAQERGLGPVVAAQDQAQLPRRQDPGDVREGTERPAGPRGEAQVLLGDVLEGAEEAAVPPGGDAGHVDGQVLEGEGESVVVGRGEVAVAVADAKKGGVQRIRFGRRRGCFRHLAISVVGSTPQSA